MLGLLRHFHERMWWNHGIRRNKWKSLLNWTLILQSAVAKNRCHTLWCKLSEENCHVAILVIWETLYWMNVNINTSCTKCARAVLRRQSWKELSKQKEFPNSLPEWHYKLFTLLLHIPYIFLTIGKVVYRKCKERSVLFSFTMYLATFLYFPIVRGGQGVMVTSLNWIELCTLGIYGSALASL